MTGTGSRVAIAGLSQLTIRPDAGLRVYAPEEAVVRGRHARVGVRQNELTLPPQCGTEVRMIGVEAIGFADHAAPPEAAFRMARFIATRASWTL